MADTVYCSFCGKGDHEVRRLIAGPTVFICDECITLCMQSIRSDTDLPEDIKESSVSKPERMVQEVSVGVRTAPGGMRVVGLTLGDPRIRVWHPLCPATARALARSLSAIADAVDTKPEKEWPGAVNDLADYVVRCMVNFPGSKDKPLYATDMVWRAVESPSGPTVAAAAMPPVETTPPIHTSGGMTFLEAVKAMADGKKVYRNSMPPLHVHLKGGEYIDDDDDPAVFIQSDFLATDWKVVE